MPSPSRRLAVALAACAAALSLAGLTGRAAEPAGPLPDGTGERLYGERCAGCHDHPTGRIPPRQVLEGNTPTFLMSAMHGGVMTAQAEGLSWPQTEALAQYISHNHEGGRLDAKAAEAPACAAPPPPFTLEGPQWNGWGRTERNARFQPDPGIAAADAPRLKLKWAIAMPGDHNGQPVIAAGRLYTNNAAGLVYALDAKSGCLYWRFQTTGGTRATMVIAALPGATPARSALYVADAERNVYALDAQSGALIWKTHVDDQPNTAMTGGLAVHDGRVFVPISSGEEFFATFDTYECCRFRGAVVALDGATGKHLWKTYTTPEEPHRFKKNAKGVEMWGPAGGAIWSAPTVDARRRLIYVGTGNSYTSVPHAGADSVMALDIDTGAIRWQARLEPKDDFIIGCDPGGRVEANCPAEVGGDFDIGASPILHELPGGKQILLVGQKSSRVWGLDPDRQGAALWSRRLSSGGPLGGVEFGPAADDDAIYVALSDIFVPKGASPGLSALRISDGTVLWTTPGETLACRWTNPFCSSAQSQAVSAIPGLVFSGAMNGRLRAYEATTGKVVWTFDTGAQTYQTLGGAQVAGGVLDGSGPVVAGGMLYVDSGYAGRSGDGATVLLAFSVDGR